MRYTPVELRHLRMSRALLGYKRDETERILEDVADSFEEVWRDRGELTDRVDELEKQCNELKQREHLLTNTLVAAEKAAAEAKELARREAEVIVAEAHQEARSVMRTAQTERERLFAEARRVETLLRAALGMVEESHSAREPDGAAGDGAAREWPNREDTREFQAVSLPEPVSLPDLSVPDPAPEGTDEPPSLPPAASEEDGPWAGRDFAWG